MRGVVLLLAVCCAASAVGAPWTAENAPWNVNFNSDGSNPSRYYGQWPGHVYFPSPRDWRDVPVYQLITDRFRDGDPTNNEGHYGGYDLYDVSKRHGGDFRGLKESLSYIKSLGFDAVWISPIFQNRVNSYHGYGQMDYTLLDDRFGTLADFRELVDEAHRLGMYIIVDLVVNHLDSFFYFEGHKDQAAPFRLHRGEYWLLPYNPKETYADFKVVNEFDPSGTYPDVYGYDGYRYFDSNGKGSYWQSDFHHNGDLEEYNEPWQVHLGKLYGKYDDLRNEHPRVQDKIIAMTKALLSSTDIDGIRMDTAMEVPLSFFKRWVPAVKEHARRLGKSNFFIFGEFYCPRPRAATMIGRGRTRDQWGCDAFIDDIRTMDSGINYPLYQHFFQPVVQEQKAKLGSAFAEYLEDRRAYDMDHYTLLNFYNNHDQWRLNWDKDGFQKSMLASGIIAFWPGIPLFYYGDEQGFASRGSALEGWSREDFMTSKAWFSVPHQGKSDFNPAVVDNFNMTHPQFLQVQKFMNLRRQYSALRNADQIQERWVQPGNVSGIWMFNRLLPDKKHSVLMAYNTSATRLEAGGRYGNLLTGWEETDRIVNALNPQERYTLGKSGKLASLWLDGYEVKVFVREDNLQPLEPVVEMTEPGHDAVVPPGKRVVKLRFSEAMQPGAFVSYDGVAIARDRPRFTDDGRGVAFEVDVKPGIHFLTVSTQATAQNGKRLRSHFRSRFRSGDSLNPIVKLQKDHLEDKSLVSSRRGSDGKRMLTFHHKATGAKLFRVSTDGGKHWTSWQTYAAETNLNLNGSATAAEAWVQYWTDGSAAYYCRCPLESR